MRDLALIGIGAGNPDHLTFQGAQAIREADLILLPLKGGEKAGLANLRRTILDRVLGDGPRTAIASFDIPRREAGGDYLANVDAWHDAIADAWAKTITEHDAPERVALLVWGDPSLYDSSLRIAARLDPAPSVRVIPGITALQALTAAHAMPLNDIGAPVLVTTGRRLARDGMPEGDATVAVMLDGRCAFRGLDPDGLIIWWGAYLGMADEILIAGPVAEVGDRIVAARAQARERHGWIMDTYLLRKRR